MPSISRITVNHVKGIEHLDVICDIVPNKPNFIVAPNGAGKSSLAVAVSSIGVRKLRVEEQNWYLGKEWGDSYLEFQFSDDTVLRVDSEKNELHSKMGTMVIRSGLYANMTNRNTGSRVLSQTKMSIRSSVIYEKVPEKVELPYSVTAERRRYARPLRSCMHNFKELLNNESFVARLIADSSIFNPTTGSRYALKIDEYFKSAINLGDKNHPVNEFAESSYLDAVQPLNSIRKWLPEYLPGKTDVYICLSAIELNRFLEGKASLLRKYYLRLSYENARKDINSMLQSVNRTRKSIVARAKKGSLVVEYPDWEEVSNGEADILQLCVALIEARVKLGSRDSALLVIDEVFDYLDDANIAVVQYYLSGLMKDFKKHGKRLYPIILTHIDPSVFKSFRFKDMHVSYMGSNGKARASICAFMKNLLVDRQRCRKWNEAVYNEVSSKYLHFDCEQASSLPETTEYLRSKSVPDRLLEPSVFRREMIDAVRRYADGKGDFDVASVCCGLRIAVEGYAYSALTDEQQKLEYLAISKGTESRLSFAEGHTGAVPEVMHLLGGIYNGCMHLSGKPGEEEVLHRQLDNVVIKAMVSDVIGKYDEVAEGQ